MLLKLAAPLSGQQPNIAAGGLATMSVKPGPRVGILYAELIVTMAALGAGQFSLPVLPNIADVNRSIFIKMGGNPQIQRRPLELADDNALQSDKAFGSVSYWQGGVKVATVYGIKNTAVPAAIASNTATTAIFQVPIYFYQPWRKNLATGESYALPTLFSDGSALPSLSVEFPIAAAAGGFSGHSCSFWMAYDNLPGTPVNGKPLPFFVKKGRTEMLYAKTGEITIPIDDKGQLMQFSLLLAAGDTFTDITIKKNGAVLRQVTKERNDQMIYDQEMNVGAVVQNRFDVVFDINDSPSAALPLTDGDDFSVVVTLNSVAGAANMVILTEVYGQPN